MTNTDNIFLFVFATLLAAVIVELWSIAKVLNRIAVVMEKQNQPESEKNAKIS